MTGQELFYALSFVDERYIAEAETANLGKRIPWMKVLSVAACLCILIVGAFALENIGHKDATEAAAPAAPMAATEAAVEEAAPAEGITGEEMTREEVTAEEPEDIYLPAVQGIDVTVQGNGREYALEAKTGMTLLELLQNQAYDPDQVCRCDVEYTVTTEFGVRYDINLQEGFVRCQEGQASLSEEHLLQLKTILENL